jgi:hypothetical protein
VQHALLVLNFASSYIQVIKIYVSLEHPEGLNNFLKLETC